MKTIQYPDIIQLPQKGEAMCVTTNGCVKKNGHAVMGKGIAKQVNDQFQVSYKLGCLLCCGNQVYHLGVYSSRQFHLFSFPTKHDWRNGSDLDLIKASAYGLRAECDKYGIQTCYLTPPGCGCGGLDYNTQVAPILEPILDDRFIVVCNH